MNKFDDIINNYKNIELKLRMVSNRISRIRLLVFIAGAGAIIYFMRMDSAMYTFIAIIGFIGVFSYVVSKHNSIIECLERAKCKIIINQKYKDRLDEKWVVFEDDGAEFIEKNHPYSVDLDLFGPKSLFQWISNTKTYFGRKYLAELLINPNKDLNAIKERQQQAEELGNSKKYEFCEKLLCEAMLSKDMHKKPDSLLEYAESKEIVFKRKWIINIFYLLPFLTIFLSALTLMNYDIPIFIPYLLVLIQIGLSGIGYLKFQRILNSVNEIKKNIGAYEKIIKLIENEKFTNSNLIRLQKLLLKDNIIASKGIKDLNRISDLVDFRYNPILYFILNIALLWDFHCVISLEDWKRKYGGHIREWLMCIGEFETISSLAVPFHLSLACTFPEFIVEEKGDARNNVSVKVGFSADKLGHPLITGGKRINNSITIKNNQCIITGSNMSGKTTMLRTIGINLVLAYAGAPVFAEKLNCSIMEIFTSMRVIDDLNSGISTFYAELLRIKLLIEYSKKKLPMIYLIDEIFRGTNSVDRITGAKSLLKSLDKEWIIGLITTHDFELCDLGNNSSSIHNYHFEEKYTNSTIEFDYKLRSGRSNTTNAKYLMKLVGIDIED